MAENIINGVDNYGKYKDGTYVKGLNKGRVTVQRALVELEGGVVGGYNRRAAELRIAARRAADIAIGAVDREQLGMNFSITDLCDISDTDSPSDTDWSMFDGEGATLVHESLVRDTVETYHPTINLYLDKPEVRTETVALLSEVLVESSVEREQTANIEAKSFWLIYSSLRRAEKAANGALKTLSGRHQPKK